MNFDEKGTHRHESGSSQVKEPSHISMDCWSILPEHLVEIFAEKLDRHKDFLSFGAICTSWRFVFKNSIHRLPSKFPISHCLPKGNPMPLLLQHNNAMHGKINIMFSLSNEKVAKVSHQLKLFETRNKWIAGSSRGWLFVVDYTTLEATLINPLTKAEVCLPSLSSLSMLVAMKNVVSSNPIVNKDDCMVMFASNFSHIYYCRVGDNKWNLLKHSHEIVNLINNKGIFYAMDTNSDLCRITMKEYTIDMQLMLVWKTYRNLQLVSRKFLVESSGDLLLVTREKANNHLDGIPHFEIFKLSRCIKHHGVNYLNSYEWKKVEDVDNRIIFLGYKEFLSVESSLYHGIKGNCIYFLDGIDDHPHIYNITNQSIEYCSLDVAESQNQSLWFSPNPW